MRRLLVPLIGAAAVLGIGYMVWPKPLSMELSAKRVLGCIDSGDAGCVLASMPESERNATGLKQDDLARLLNAYVRPAYAGLGQPTVKISSNKDYGTLNLSQTWARGARPPAIQGVIMAITPDGPCATNVVQNLVFNTMMTKYRKKTDEHPSLARIRGLEMDGPVLTHLGFPGIPRENGEFKTWKEIADDWKTKAIAHGLKPE